MTNRHPAWRAARSPRAAASGRRAPRWRSSRAMLRIAMTAADVPTTTGMPNNGFEGMRFLGYPVFEALVRLGPVAIRPSPPA